MMLIAWPITVPLAIIKIPFASASLKILFFSSRIRSRTPVFTSVPDYLR
jgi:hypothetical protein